MIKKIYTYLSEHGFLIMICGFAFAVASLLVYMQTRYRGTVTPQIAFGCTICGFVVYVIGRIFLATSRKKNRQTLRSQALEAKDDM